MPSRLNLDQPYHSTENTPRSNNNVLSFNDSGTTFRNNSVFEILDDDYFDTPILSCAIPEQGTFSLSIQPILRLDGIPSKIRSALVKTNMTLHFATVSGAAMLSAILIASMAVVLIAVSYEDCGSLTKNIVPNECYFLLIFLFVFILIRMGLLKSYVIQPTTAIFQIVNSTPRELFSLAVTGILWSGFIGIIQGLDGTLQRGHYTTAIILTILAIVILFSSLFAFGDHTRSYLFRQGIPNLEVPESKPLELPLFISGCGMQHLCDSIVDSKMKQLVVSLDQWMEFSQQIMLNILVMALALNVYGLMLYMVTWNDCDTVQHQIDDIVYVESMFIPLVMICFAFIRVYLMKACAARPVAKFFNLKKKAGASWLLMILCFLCWGAFMYLTYYYFLENQPKIGLLFSFLASLFGGGGISFFYSQHVTTLVKKVKITVEHTTTHNTRL